MSKWTPITIKFNKEKCATIRDDGSVVIFDEYDVDNPPYDGYDAVILTHDEFFKLIVMWYSVKDK